jgi:hypothetical protein
MIAFLPLLPSLFFGLILIWQQGLTLTSISFVFLMVLFSVVSSFFIWTWHTDHVEKVKNYHQKKFKERLNALSLYAAELERLLLTAETKLAEQVKAAKDMSEQEASQLDGKLAAFNDVLKQLAIPVPKLAPEGELRPPNFDVFNQSIDKLRNDFDAIIQALQIEKKSNQILTLVLSNLTTIKETIEQVQKDDAQRNKKLLNVDAMMTTIQTQYESVKRDKNTAVK